MFKFAICILLKLESCYYACFIIILKKYKPLLKMCEPMHPKFKKTKDIKRLHINNLEDRYYTTNAYKNAIKIYFLLQA